MHLGKYLVHLAKDPVHLGTYPVYLETYPATVWKYPVHLASNAPCLKSDLYAQPPRGVPCTSGSILCTFWGVPCAPREVSGTHLGGPCLCTSGCIPCAPGRTLRTSGSILRTSGFPVHIRKYLTRLGKYPVHLPGHPVHLGKHTAHQAKYSVHVGKYSVHLETYPAHPTPWGTRSREMTSVAASRFCMRGGRGCGQGRGRIMAAAECGIGTAACLRPHPTTLVGAAAFQRPRGVFVRRGLWMWPPRGSACPLAEVGKARSRLKTMLFVTPCAISKRKNANVHVYLYIYIGFRG